MAPATLDPAVRGAEFPALALAALVGGALAIFAGIAIARPGQGT